VDNILQSVGVWSALIWSFVELSCWFELAFSSEVTIAMSKWNKV
jgi:hypothetical protein